MARSACGAAARERAASFWMGCRAAIDGEGCMCILAAQHVGDVSLLLAPQQSRNSVSIYCGIPRTKVHSEGNSPHRTRQPSLTQRVCATTPGPETHAYLCGHLCHRARHAAPTRALA